MAILKELKWPLALGVIVGLLALAAIGPESGGGKVLLLVIAVCATVVLVALGRQLVRLLARRGGGPGSGDDSP